MYMKGVIKRFSTSRIVSQRVLTMPRREDVSEILYRHFKSTEMKFVSRNRKTKDWSCSEKGENIGKFMIKFVSRKSFTERYLILAFNFSTLYFNFVHILYSFRPII